jgi:hypothetical protein
VVNGDGEFNYTESDLVDTDGDGYNDEIDPLDTGPWANCIPSNFGSGCTLDYDHDNITDVEETPAGDADANSAFSISYLADGVVNRLESLTPNGYNIDGTSNYVGSGSA